jgi:hypothetical protein
MKVGDLFYVKENEYSYCLCDDEGSKFSRSKRLLPGCYLILDIHDDRFIEIFYKNKIVLAFQRKNKI